MAIHNPVTICGTDSSGESEAVNVTNGAIPVASTPNFVDTAANCQTQANTLSASQVGVYTFFATDTNRYGTLSNLAGGTGTITWETTGGAALVNNREFIPSSYDTDITIVAGTAQYGALATGVKLGGGKVRFLNRSATTHDARVVFGISEADCLANLNVAGGLATTGYYLPAMADGGSASEMVLTVPALATHYGVLNATASKTPTVAITQGI